jgi:hypothetical protein
MPGLRRETLVDYDIEALPSYRVGREEEGGSSSKKMVLHECCLLKSAYKETH